VAADGWHGRLASIREGMIRGEEIGMRAHAELARARLFDVELKTLISGCHTRQVELARALDEGHDVLVKNGAK
jgi:hypothetical protein